MTEVTTRPMSQSEFENWQQDVARDFAKEQVAAGFWSEDEALDLALQGNAALLPSGLATSGMLLLMGVLEDKTPTGRLWVGLTHPRGVHGCAFLYDIEVDQAYRGMGYGRALLRATEAAARSHGAEQIELNVFGDNRSAIDLYAKAGFRVVTQQMRKRLS